MYKDDENNKIQYYDYNDNHNELINDEESNNINLVLKERVNPWYFDTNIINTKNKQFKITGIEKEEINNIINIKKKNDNNYICYIMFFMFIIITIIILIKLKN